MKKINKIINIVIIFMLIGVFLCPNPSYSEALRVPLDTKYTRMKLLMSEEVGKISQDTTETADQEKMHEAENQLGLRSTDVSSLNSTLGKFSNGSIYGFDVLEVIGGKPLKGTIRLDGSKHSVVVLMGALLLADGRITVDNFPKSNDGLEMLKIYESFGLKADLQGNKLSLFVDADKLQVNEKEITRTRSLRASILLLGSALLRFGHIKFPIPGGDQIGRDFHKHFEILDDFGIQHNEYDADILEASIPGKLQGDRTIDAKIADGSGSGYSGVYTTALAMILAAGNNGKTIIENAIVTNEITELGEFFRKIGVEVTGLRTERIAIQSPGIETLRGVNVIHKIPSDKSEIVFWIVAAMMTKGSIDIVIDYNGPLSLDNLGPIGSFYRDVLEPMGIHLEQINEQTFRADYMKSNLKPINLRAKYQEDANVVDVLMNVFPLLAVIPGASTFTDEKHGNIRLRSRIGLNAMGANVEMLSEGGMRFIGVEKLYGSNLRGEDIRDASNLLLAALAAQGTSRLEGMRHIYRSYGDIIAKLNKLGANIYFKRNELTGQQSSLFDAVFAYLIQQRFGVSLYNDEGNIFIRTILNSFGDEIQVALKDCGTLEEAVKVHHYLTNVLSISELSRMFRYKSAYEQIKETFLLRKLNNLAIAYQTTKQRQSLNIGMIGAGYGQEMISNAIWIDNFVRQFLEERRLPADTIQAFYHVLNKNCSVFEKLKRNDIIYPSDIQDFYKENISRDDLYSYFISTDKGLKRSQSFNNRLVFYDVDLLDENSFNQDMPRFDMLFVHNVLNHVSSLVSDLYSYREVNDKIVSVEKYITSLVKESGLISLIGIGDNFFGGENYQAIEGFTLAVKPKDPREKLLIKLNQAGKALVSPLYSQTVISLSSLDIEASEAKAVSIESSGSEALKRDKSKLIDQAI